MSEDHSDLRHNSTLSKQEIRHKEFVEYLNKIGLREYENGTVFFYEDEYVNKTKRGPDESSIIEDPFNKDLIEELFEGDKPIRISRDNKQDEYSKSHQNSLLMDMKDIFEGEFDADEEIHELPEPDLAYENYDDDGPSLDEKDRRGGKARKKKKVSYIEYFEPIVRKKEKLKQGDDLKSKVYKKLTGTKDRTIASEENNFDEFGRRLFSGKILK